MPMEINVKIKMNFIMMNCVFLLNESFNVQILL